MFNIDKNKNFESDLPLIIDNYQVLHFDEIPILFTGTNKYGNRILASSVDEDYDKNIARFFHVLVENSLYNKFLRQKISYKEILLNTKEIFVIDKTLDDKLLSTYIISSKNIPDDYFPIDSSFCPEQNAIPLMNYSLSLKGKLADIHNVIPKELSIIQNSFADFLSKVIDGLKRLDLTQAVFITSYEPGSFKINYKIQIQTTEPDLFYENATINNFFNQYVKFCISELPNEASEIFNNKYNDTPFYNLLKSELNNLYTSRYRSVEESVIDEILQKNLSYSANRIEDIAENIGENFTGLEITNDRSDGVAQQIGFIDAEFKEQINQTVEIIEKINEKVSIDQDFKKYKITIYSLNTDTRKGNAYIEHNDILYKPKIVIDGDGKLEETKYTESLYLSKKINILGKAKRVNEKIKHIDVLFE